MLRATTGKKPLLAGLWGVAERGGGGGEGTQEVREKTSWSKNENHNKVPPIYCMASPPGFEPRPQLLPNILLFTCLTIHQFIINDQFNCFSL